LDFSIESYWKFLNFRQPPVTTKKTLYRVADPFLSFYYRYVAPNRSFIELERYAPIKAQMEVSMNGFIAGWWEKICRDAVTGNTIDGITYGEARRWWGTINRDGTLQEVELDVVAESIDKKYILIGECKWTNVENAEALTSRLESISKVLPFAKDKTLIFKLFLRESPTCPLANHLLPQDIIDLSK